MFLCFECDVKRKVLKARPAPGKCSRCRGGASRAGVRSIYRFCYIPIFCIYRKEVICTQCKTHLHNY